MIVGLGVAKPADMAVDFVRSNFSVPVAARLPAVGPVSERVMLKSFERNSGRPTLTAEFCRSDTLRVPLRPAWFCADAGRIQHGVTTSVAARMVIFRIRVPFSQVRPTEREINSQ